MKRESGCQFGNLILQQHFFDHHRWNIFQRHAEHGNLNVPKLYTTPGGLSLGVWLVTQRRVREGQIQGILTEQQIQRLDSIGMVWGNRKEIAWQHGFEVAKKYHDTYGNLMVPGKYVDPDGYPLGQWIIKTRQQKLNGRLKEERIAQLDEIGMVCEKCRENGNFKEAIKNKCYRNSTLGTIIVAAMLTVNRKLGEIAQLAQKCRKDQNFRILTYNYDDFLEQYLEWRGVKCCSMFTTKVRYSNGQASADFYGVNGQPNQSLRLYHVHGFLPKVATKSQLDTLHIRSICLTEADYNMLYNQPYSWPIASQLSFFRENICLFIGCSLSDPNIRRLLEITAYNPPKHYAILPMMYKSTDASGAVVPKQFTTKDRLQIENHFYRIGINILWVRDYSAIPEWLHKLNRSIV